jgi:hypothetical protein
MQRNRTSVPTACLLGVSVAMLACGSRDLQPVDNAELGVAQLRVINGVRSAHPAVVSLHRLSKKWGGAISGPFCTGTVISPSRVLTAAHCLDKAGDTAPVAALKPNEVAVYVGEDPWSDEDGDGTLNLLERGGDGYYIGLHSVSGVTINPEYDKFALLNDIGYLDLSAAPLQPWLGPVSVDYAGNPVTPVDPLPGTETLAVGEAMTIIGFGLTDVSEDSSGGVEMAGQVTLDAILPDNQLQHLYSPTGQTICFGDSGGPAIVGEGTQYVAGVASYTTAPVCADTGVHTKVDAYQDFVCSGCDDCAVCSGCGSDADCDDGNACNGSEQCIDGACVAGTEVTCTAPDACSSSSCNSETGLCEEEPIVCDDGDACNGEESCDPASGCIPGTPVGCVNGDGCCNVECDASNDDDCAPEPGDCASEADRPAGCPCEASAQCASGKCTGRPGSKTCK